MTEPKETGPQENAALGETTGHESRVVEAPYVKGSLCRTVYVNGAWGGVTQDSNIYMAVYWQRQALPEKATYEVDAAGLGYQAPERPTSRLVREVEVELVMNQSTALAFRDWLTDKIEKVELLQKAAREREETALDQEQPGDVE